MTFCIIIPARFKSKRLPGKPLIKINNETLIEKTYKNLIKRINKKDIFITSDSMLVLNSMKKHTNNLILVNNYCRNGTERSSHALKNIPKKYKHILICSCDMPFLSEESLDYIISKKIVLKNNKLAGITLHAKIYSKQTYQDHSTAKIILNKKNEIQFLIENLKEGQVAVDIGAHKGLWTLYMMNIYPSSLYKLFEAGDYKELKNLKKFINIEIFNNIILNENDGYVDILNNNKHYNYHIYTIENYSNINGDFISVIIPIENILYSLKLMENKGFIPFDFIDDIDDKNIGEIEFKILFINKSHNYNKLVNDCIKSF